MTGFELTALLWGAAVGGLFTFAHFACSRKSADDRHPRAALPPRRQQEQV